ncbi:[protein-PII] uridylyltransferase [Opitutaceae bacterium TAV4]|nr:[protein-PII] uridylyltransferase [Opitutaceae bacterium TAV4]RRK00606.1 [protein-PII] uridylyltransferase [Opitutaceae bacterium TAV3]
MNDGRIRKHARERLLFLEDTPVAKRLAACKRFLRLESAMIRMRHDARESGLAIARARAALADVMLTHLFDYALAAYERRFGTLPAPVALLALGGYGRSELSPLSDIDIMFLFPAKIAAETIKPLQHHLIDEVLYLLWDSGLKVGYSTRTIDEVFAEAKRDIQTKTALLEARFVAGNAVLYDGFSAAYRSYYTTDNPRAYIAARLQDQADRRSKYSDTVFVQEPDIKNGVGGLRDYQNMIWMARVKLDITHVDELEPLKYLRRNELRDAKRAYDFLLRTRNELHFQSKRPTDLLDLEAQPRVGYGLGYMHTDPLARVEQFMRDYYRSAQTLFRVSRLVENRLALNISPAATSSLPLPATAAAAPPPSRFSSLLDIVRARRVQRVKRIDGFILRGSELTAENPRAIFKDDPVRLIRLFRHCQTLDAQPDFALQALIRESLPLLRRNVTHDSGANTAFRAILQQTGAVYPTLALMHELGVLGRFIPEFDGLTCLVQHEFYHRYTADIHTLNAIRQLDIVFSEAEPIAAKYRLALHESARPTLLYLTLLLHDIGKARGIKGHAEAGVAIAAPILERMGVEEADRELVLFIIKNHLIMARFWQKRDVDDPDSAIAFAQLALDAERLRHLYVHTFCDSRGTSAGLWNSYKDTLHTTLFRATLVQLTSAETQATRNSQRLQMIKQELISKNLPGISADEISAHFGLLPERYFVQTEADEITLHIQMVNRLIKTITQADTLAALTPVIDWHDDLNRSLTVVNIVTWDRAGLFYKLAGAFSVAGLSILSAKVISRTDHIAIDTFYVVEPGRGVVQSPKAQETFARTVEAALVSNKDLYPEILAQARRHTSILRPAHPAGDTLHAAFPTTVEVYNELSMRRTIVEVQARDEIGLLFKLARLISEQGFDITFARIGTERGIAIDTFYIEDAQPALVTTADDNDGSQSLANTGRLHALREALLQALAPAAAPEAAAG